MEPLFENSGTPDIRGLTEMRYRIGMKRTWFWIGVYLVLGTICLYCYLLGNVSVLSPLILYGYCIYLLLFPYFRIRKGLKEEAAFHGGKLPVNTARFTEKIQIANTSASQTWEYAHLIKAYSMKYCYCLRFADDRVLVLDRANFTKGTFEEFKVFLRQKRPDLKIPE